MDHLTCQTQDKHLAQLSFPAISLVRHLCKANRMLAWKESQSLLWKSSIIIAGLYVTDLRKVSWYVLNLNIWPYQQITRSSWLNFHSQSTWWGHLCRLMRMLWWLEELSFATEVFPNIDWVHVIDLRRVWRYLQPSNGCSITFQTQWVTCSKFTHSQPDEAISA